MGIPLVPPVIGASYWLKMKRGRRGAQMVSLDANVCIPVMRDVWRYAAAPMFAHRRIIDVRLALTFRAAGVTDFATRNVKDFADFGFDRVWDSFQ